MCDAKRNKLFQCGYEPEQKKSATKARGMFFELSEVEQEAIVLVGMRDAPATRARTNDAILAQELHDGGKKSLLRRKVWNKPGKSSSKDYITTRCISQMRVGKMTKEL
jgi:hypothetical protein